MQGGTVSRTQKPGVSCDDSAACFPRTRVVSEALLVPRSRNRRTAQCTVQLLGLLHHGDVRFVIAKGAKNQIIRLLAEQMESSCSFR